MRKWNVTPLIRRGSIFFFAAYCCYLFELSAVFACLSCLLLPACPPDGNLINLTFLGEKALVNKLWPLYKRAELNLRLTKCIMRLSGQVRERSVYGSSCKITCENMCEIALQNWDRATVKIEGMQIKRTCDKKLGWVVVERPLCVMWSHIQ